MRERQLRPVLPLRIGIVLVSVAAVLVALRIGIPAAPGNNRMAPSAALAHVPPALRSEPVFNAYEFGGYLIFEGIRPFIDGRADMYGSRLTVAYDRMSQPDPAALLAGLQQYGIIWTLLPRGSLAAALMDFAPGWERAYADTIAVVHVRSEYRK
jgi:hypothetical protein